MENGKIRLGWIIREKLVVNRSFLEGLAIDGQLWERIDEYGTPEYFTRLHDGTEMIFPKDNHEKEIVVR